MARINNYKTNLRINNEKIPFNSAVIKEEHDDSIFRNDMAISGCAVIYDSDSVLRKMANDRFACDSGYKIETLTKHPGYYEFITYHRAYLLNIATSMIVNNVQAWEVRFTY